MIDLSVNLNGLKLKNPVTVASGTFGFGREYENFFDLSKLGAISVKGLTLEERLGNQSPRIVETNMGMINSVGLQNPGVEYFIKNEIPFLRQFDTKVIANVNGNCIEEYAQIARILDGEDVDSIEVNISCPNVKNGGMLFGTDPEMAYKVVKRVREKTNKHIIAKLTPNVTDIKVIAMAVEEAGANAISMVNTFAAMAIDVETQKPILKRKYGGLAGPGIKPIAIKLVFDVFSSVKIPIIGMGGITNTEDALEFILAGASAIGIGTYNFVNPFISIEIIDGIKKYMIKKNINDFKNLVGKAHFIE